MIGVVLVVAVAALFWMVRRARRLRTLAGLNAAKPVYFAEPPRRYSTGLEDHRL